MSFDFSTLVTDRTAADVSARKDKGHYNASDLNRVNAACLTLAEKMRGYGYVVSISLPIIENDRTEWLISDIPTAAQMAHYLQNVAKIRSVLDALPTTPEVPADMSGLTYQEANEIEQILVDVEILLNNMAAAWFYSGEIYSGEV